MSLRTGISRGIVRVCLAALLVGCLPGQEAEAGANEPAQVYQQTPGDSSLAPVPQDGIFNPFGTVLLAGGIMVIFSLALYYGLRLFKSGLYGKSFQGRAPAVKLLGSTFLGPRKSLCMVQVLDRLLVLGLGEHDITKLLEIPLADLSEEQKQQVLHNTPQKPADFKKILAKWTKK